jgi:hypothetical protein
MPQFAKPVGAPTVKQAMQSAAAAGPQPRRASPQRSAMWHVLQLKAAQAAAPAPAAPNRAGLPNRLKAGVERLSGIAMDDVRVHRNSAEPARLGALAYAQGSDIHLGPGQEQHLPHEAWHVVQQKQGRVKPTAQLKTGVPVNGDQTLEREADVMGARALSGRTGSEAPIGNAVHMPVPSPSQAIQRMTVGGHAVASTVSGTTHGKHVVALLNQATTAAAEYGSRTFVLADADLTGPVDLNAHNFAANNQRSARTDINANVTIYQYDKRPPFPAGLAANQPVDRTINGVATNCEIGAVKTGPGAVEITHFKKV